MATKRKHKTMKVPATPAAAKSATDPEPPNTDNSCVLSLTKLIHALSKGSEEEREFFRSLVQKWHAGAFNLIESAFILSAPRFGYDFLTDILNTDPEHPTELKKAHHALCHDTWFSRFLEGILDFHDKHNGKVDPHHVLWYLQEEIDEYRIQIETTRDMLHGCPAMFKGEIQEAIREHPEIMAN
jgi:hypothetical protein